MMMMMMMMMLDVDECLTTPHVCSQRCTNTIGSYTCSCAANYTLGNNGQCIRFSDCTSHL